MKTKKVFIPATFLVLFGIFSFSIGKNIGFNDGKLIALRINDDYRQSIVQEILMNNPLPRCWGPNCPEYTFFDVNNDGLTESVVIEYTAMTQQAGRVWIIDNNGVVIFKSDELAQISISPRDNHEADGFVIGYAKLPKMSRDWMDSFMYETYKYINGKFVLEKSESQNRESTQWKNGWDSQYKTKSL